MTKSATGMPSVKPKGTIHADMFGINYTIETVPWSLVKFDPNANVRPRGEYDADLWGALELVPRLRLTKGKPKTAPSFHLDTSTGELTILQGNRRYLALAKLREEDPKEIGYQEVEAHIYRDLSHEQQAKLKMDHAATEKPLSRHGLYLSIIECSKLGMSEAETIAFLRGALSSSYSEDKNPKEPNDSKDVFKQYRGFVRNCRWAHEIAPVERALVAKFTGKGINFPTNNNVEDAHKGWIADKAADGRVTKTTPDTAPELCPNFFAAWQKALDAEEERAGKGVKRARNVTPLNAEQFNKLATTSFIMNAIKAGMKKDAKDPKIITDVVDPILARIEAFMTDEDREALLVAMNGPKGKTGRVAVEPSKTEGTPKTGRKVKA